MQTISIVWLNYYTDIWLNIQAIWIIEICTAITFQLIKKSVPTMKVMWPPNNKVNESIKKCNSERARKNCVSQRRKWKQCYANVFLNRKIQWIPIHLRGHCCLKFSFFLASATEFFFLIRTHECNSGSQWICYFFPFPIVSSIRTFYPLERALRHISIHISIHCISRY